MKIGDYVRTDKGTIDKLTRENIMTYEVALMGFGEKPIKSSSNIIDLIQVGDYVNGLKVQEVNNEIKGFGTIVFDKDTSIMEDYIYSIVTKEQFSQMEYKIGD